MAGNVNKAVRLYRQWKKDPEAFKAPGAGGLFASAQSDLDHGQFIEYLRIRDEPDAVSETPTSNNKE